MNLTLAELLEKLQQWQHEGIDMNQLIYDDDSSEFAVSDIFFIDEEQRIYISFEEVE